MLRKQDIESGMELDYPIGYDSAARKVVSFTDKSPTPKQPLLDENLLRQSGEAAVWKECAQAVAKAFTGADKETAMDLVRKIQARQWGNERFYYTLGQVDIKTLNALCAQKAVEWQWALVAKACFGTADEVNQIERGADQKGVVLNLDCALHEAAQPRTLVPGLFQDGNFETAECLLKMGANPRPHDNGDHFSKIVDLGRKDIGALFVRYAHGTINVNYWAQQARHNGKMKLCRDLRDIASEYGNFYVVDNETLKQTKLLDDDGSKLTVLFNFASRRVTEMLDIASPRQLATKDFSFDDYGRPALVQAHAKLLELGGRPTALEQELEGKSALPRKIVPRPLSGG